MRVCSDSSELTASIRPLENVAGSSEGLGSRIGGLGCQVFFGIQGLGSRVKKPMTRGFLHELLCHLFAGRDDHKSRVEVARVERVRHGGKLFFDGKEVSDWLQHHLGVAKHSRISDVHNVLSIFATVSSSILIAGTWLLVAELSGLTMSLSMKIIFEKGNIQRWSLV